MRWNCQIKGCRLAHRFDPGLLDGCLPRGSSFGDMDAWVEVDGRFLFIEHKGEGVSLQGGQGPALKRLARQENCTVWLVRDLPMGWYEMRDMATHDAFVAVSLDGLRALVTRWGELA
jgi:hypothetical protein